MNQRSILITGCSSGIGYDAAHTLKAQGWRVFASCRQPLDCARLREEGFESPLIDYENPDSIITGLAEVLEATGGQLDALFNNGAYAIPGAVEDIPTQALRAIFEANFFGWHELTRAVIPVMRAQGHGHILQCSSVLGFVAMPWRGAYVASKYALEGLTDTLRIELRDTPIRVVLIEPGSITTKFRKNSAIAFERWVDWRSSARSVQYEEKLRPRLYAADGPPDTFELPASAVTAKVIKALNSDKPKPRYYVTTATYIMGALRRVLTSKALDKFVAKL